MSTTSPTPPTTFPSSSSRPPTSTNWNLASPAAVRAADTMLCTPRKEIVWLTGVHQDVTVRGQVHAHNVGIGWAPRLLTGVSWRASRGRTNQYTHTHTSGTRYKHSCRHSKTEEMKIKDSVWGEGVKMKVHKKRTKTKH